MYLLLFLLAVATTALAENSYVIIGPAKFRANADLSLSVDIIRATSTVTVTASVLKDTTVLATASGSFQAGVPGTLTVKIPADVTSGSYTLKVEGSGGLTFSNTETLTFNSKQVSTFVQTDKAIYKPGDAVNWRVFATDSDLKLYTGNFNISIHDAAGNKIKQWLQEKPTEGVVTGQLILSTQPALGDWKIRVETSNSNTEKIFTVAQYVLPKFEAIVKMPPFVLTTENDITVRVEAKYTYGKPVKGSAVVNVKVLHNYNSHDPSKAVPVSTIQAQVDGEGTIIIPLADVKKVSDQLDGHFLIVTANVSESLTKNTMSADGKVKMYDHAVMLEFPQTNPSTFKPGLQYTAYLKISQPDGLPAMPSNQKVKVNVDLVLEQSKVSTKSDSLSRFPQYPSETITLPEKEFALSDNGLIMIPLDVPANARSATIRAEYQGVSNSLSLGKSLSPSNSYMQMFLETSSTIQAGDVIAFRAKATYPLTIIVYQVLSRGKIVKSGSINANGQAEYTFSITSDPSMAPKSRIVVYNVKTGGEIVTDSISFVVNGTFRNKVSVNVNTSDAEPGQEVKVTVHADPKSTAHLLAIDQSVLLLKSGNDVTSDNVYQEMESYDTVDPVWQPHQGEDCFRCFRKKRSLMWYWPIVIAGKDASDVFRRAGVIVVTDALVYKEPIRRPWFGPVFMLSNAVARADGQPELIASPSQPVDAAVGTDLKEPTRTRTKFDETWLWTNMSIGADGTASTVSKVPDTITSWVVSAFAVNSETGLGIAPTQAKFRVFRPFFVTVNLPYSVIRGEKIILQAIVFNYMQEDMTVRVTLARSNSFSNIVTDAKGQEQSTQEDVVRNVLVKAGDAKSFFFPITPLKLGKIDIEVKAQSTKAADAMRRQLLVKAEGVSKEYNVPVLIDLTDGKTSFSQTLNLSLPANVVNGSQRAQISAYGDLMGTTILNLDSLLQMPTGCGEQTMLSLAPDVSIVSYLKAVNQLTPDIKSKAFTYMETGYQRVLTYKHKDGSFSAFGESDKSGSMWLTSFVMRVVGQAKNHIYIDDQVMIISLKWIIAKQNSDGSFPEPGIVIHKSMQGNAAGGLPLTLYVLMTLVENKDVLNAAGSNADQAIAKALAYAEAKVANTDDIYTLALASYAFEIAKSTQIKAVLTKLEAKATVKDGMTFWHQVQVPTTSTSTWENPNPTQSTDTEMTAYILLTYTVRGEIAKAKNIVKWLTKQRNPYGGYQSTQDTVVALHSLSEFAKIIYSNNFNLQVTATLSPTQAYTFNIDQTNALVLQRHETNEVPSKIKIDASGSGIALFEVAVSFNVQSEIETVTFDLTVKLIEETKNHLVVETCSKWLGEGVSSGMAIQEFGIPSGFKFDKDSFAQLDILKQIEIKEGQVVFYFDQIGTTPVCLQVKVDRDGLVAGNQPVAVRVIDYYNPNNQVTAFYQSQILKDLTIVDLCSDKDNCVLPSVHDGSIRICDICSCDVCNSYCKELL